MSDEFDDIGPIDYIVVEFPGNQMTGEGVPILLDLVDKGTIRLLDLMAIVKDADGNVTVAELSQVPELAALARGISGILDDSDVAEVAEILGCSSGTVKTHLSRGPLKLADRLGDDAAQENEEGDAR